jgi:hypothetical protein
MALWTCLGNLLLSRNCKVSAQHWRWNVAPSSIDVSPLELDRNGRGVSVSEGESCWLRDMVRLVLLIPDRLSI